MKIAPRDIENFVKNPSANIQAVLLYGPDEGLIRERLNVLTKTVVADISDPFNVVDVAGSSLSDNPALLSDEANSISMLGGRKVVRLRDASDKTTNAVKSAIAQLTAESNLVLIEAGELSPRSSLRLFFEQEKNVATIPCYVEDQRGISRIINESLREVGFRAPTEVINHIAANVVGDRAIARSEVAKLITYMGDEKNIRLEDAQACIGNSADLSLDDLAKFVASGKFAEADRILTFILSEGVSAVAILRNLQNYFMRLHLTKSRIEQGENTDIAIKKLKPPIFFKAKPFFEAQLRNWSLSALDTALNIIISAEAKCKQTANTPETICGRAVLSLSQMGLKAFRGR